MKTVYDHQSVYNVFETRSPFETGTTIFFLPNEDLPIALDEIYQTICGRIVR